jgi:hypothetical protein
MRELAGVVFLVLFLGLIFSGMIETWHKNKFPEEYI